MEIVYGDLCQTCSEKITSQKMYFWEVRRITEFYPILISKFWLKFLIFQMLCIKA